MKNISRKALVGIVIIAVSLLLSDPASAFAHTGEEANCVCDVKCSEDNVNEECPVCRKDYSLCQGEEVKKHKKEKMGPLTPSGNMTLVDDYGSPNKKGKQFITVTSKNGNYFYIIIDRDDNGNESVHFLNMVDEADLLALMDDEEQKKYAESLREEEPTEVVEEPTEEPVEEPVKQKKGPNVGILILMIVTVSAGIFFYLYKKTQGQKPSNTNEDPDRDYMENDETEFTSSLDEELDTMDEDNK